MKPLVSILIPAYNAEKFIGQTLFSAVHQTYPHTEIIVVDDGSTDRTAEVVSQFSGVRLVQQKNQGAAAARNHAYSLCSGDYVQWMDADDVLHPQKIEHQMNAVNGDKKLLFSCAWGKFHISPSDTVFRETPLCVDFLSPADFLTLKFQHNAFMHPNCWLVSRELTESTEPWNTAMHVDDDGEYFFRIVATSHGVKYVSDAKMYYRYSGPTGLSHIGTSNKKLDAQWRSLQMYVSRLLAIEDSDRTRDACAQLLNDWQLYFYPERMDIVKGLERLCFRIGRSLNPPRLPGKYQLVKSIFGWSAGKYAMRMFPIYRWKLKMAVSAGIRHKTRETVLAPSPDLKLMELHSNSPRLSRK